MIGITPSADKTISEDVNLSQYESETVQSMGFARSTTDEPTTEPPTEPQTTTLPPTELPTQPATEPITEPATEEPTTAYDDFSDILLDGWQQSPTYYVLNTSTKKFHEPNCAEVDKIKDANYSTIEDRATAINRGYDPCQKCYP